MASVKGNIFLNGINTITSIIFPVITFPYAARVLLPEGIGAVNFLNSIVNYIVLLTSLGIPMYALKEVAKYRNDIHKRNKITIELILLSSILCIIGYLIVLILSKCVPQINDQSALFYILSLSIFFNAIGVNWYYQGIEDFKFITIRGVIFRLISALSLFLFVKDSKDILIYGLIIVGSTVGNNLINFINLKSFINLKDIDLTKLNILKHIKPSIEIFLVTIIISLYVQLNSIMLGFISGEEAVGFYSGGIKITQVAQTLIVSLGTVMVPHCAHMIHIGDLNGFHSTIKKSLQVTLCVAYPLLFGSIILAKPIILTFCGPDYYASIDVFRYNTPLILLSCISSLIATQVLFTQERIKPIIKSVTVGAILDIILNYLLIPLYGASGASITATLTEGVVLIMLFLLGYRYIPFKPRDLINIKYILSSLFMSIIICLIIRDIQNLFNQLWVGLFIGSLSYVAIMILIKDAIFYELVGWITKKLHINKS